MRNNLIKILVLFAVCRLTPATSQQQVHPDARFSEAGILLQKANGFKGIWYMNQPSKDEYVYKYSGGLGTYPANHRPFAVYARAVNKTFFCFGGTDDNNSTLLHNVSYYDHASRKVANPTILLDKRTTDAHDNPVISIDDQGYIWIFSTSHGTGRPSYIHKSKKPYAIDDFETIPATEKANGTEQPFTNFSYFQVYHQPGKGFIALFTKYNKQNHRVIGYNTSPDGIHWNEWKVIAHIEQGHYQVSAESNGKVGIAFDFHPQGKGLNYRTNLHYLETTDFGNTWQTAGGETVSLPLTSRENPALIKDFVTDKLNCYLLDIAFDSRQQPAILAVSSKGYQAGPSNGPRQWRLFRFGAGSWQDHTVTTSDSNYDMGSIFFDTDKHIRIIGPTIDGPQVYNPGGEVAVWETKNGGASWKLSRQLTRNSRYNHTYVRRPLRAHPDFLALWADGHGRKPSESFLYFSNRKGQVFQLPRNFTEDAINATKINSQTP